MIERIIGNAVESAAGWSEPRARAPNFEGTRMRSASEQWSAAQALALHEVGTRAAIRTMIDQHRTRPDEARTLQLLTELSTWHRQRSLSPTLVARGEQYVLFFDGGSRGNPGPGGSGAVIVATDQTGTAASIVWAAAMSYSQQGMTNNRAEYLGAIAGLRAAWQHKWMPLDVVGDSALILGQLRDYRAPKNDQLKPLYARARVLADKLGVAHWLHHFRVHNKMADAAANIAMDARASTQVFFPTPRPAYQVLQAHLAGDFQQWQVGSQEWLHSQDQDLSLDSSS